MKRTLEVFGEKLEVMILEVLANVVMKAGFKQGVDSELRDFFFLS